MIKPISKQAYYETSHKQRHEWKYAHSRHEEEFLFKIKLIKYAKHLDLEIFKKVFKYIINRHESLRTNFVIVNGVLMQKVNFWNPKKYFIHYVDLRKEINPYIIDDLIKKEESRMVNYSTESLITVQVYNIADNRYVIVLFVEHIIFDSKSSNLIIEELKFLYSRFTFNKRISIDQPKIQLKDYVAWKNNHVNRKSNKSYWKNKSNDDSYIFDLKKFYTSFGKRNVCLKKGMKGKYIFYINEEFMSTLSSTSDIYNVSLPGLLISTFIIFLSKIFEQRNILVSILSMGRETKGVEGLIANCTDFIFLFVDIKENIKLREMVQSIYFKFFSSARYQFPWSDDGTWPFSNKNLFKINYLPMNINGSQKIVNFQTRHDQIKSPGITSTSYLQFTECENGIELECKYSLYYYSTDMIEFLCENYLILLKNIVEYPYEQVGDLKLTPL